MPRTDSFALAAVNKANRMTKQMQRHYCGNKVTENSTFYRDILLLHLPAPFRTVDICKHMYYIGWSCTAKRWRDDLVLEPHDMAEEKHKTG